jgi:(p)ppGpp synthase/HD superfamily hydrolase
MDTIALLRAQPLKRMDAASLLLEVNTPLDGRIHSAAALAAWAHRGGRRLRRGDLPVTHYIEHPLRVAARLRRWGTVSADLIVAALLHDTVEDCADDICRVLGQSPHDEASARDEVLAFYEQEFGAEAAFIVRALTNPLTIDEQPGHRRQAEYRRHVVQAVRDPRVAVCKFADFADNALSLHHTADVSNPDRNTVRRARKYLPLLPVFDTRLREDDVRAFVSPQGHDAMLTACATGAARLSKLATSTRTEP